MTVEILDLARDDLIEGYYFYEQREEGIGRHFLDNLYSDIEALELTGGNHRKVYRDFHRALSKKFPFAIYYTVKNEMVSVRAVVDCRRSPSWVTEHLNNA
jgi:hypothetical protein